MKAFNTTPICMNTLRAFARRVSVAILISGTAAWVTSGMTEERTVAPVTLQAQQAPAADARVDVLVSPTTRRLITPIIPALPGRHPASSARPATQVVPSAVVAEPSEVEDFTAS